MKFAVIIVAVAAIAIGIIHIRRSELSISHDMQKLELQGIKYRRQIWQKQLELGRITASPSVRQQVANMGLDLMEGGSAAMATPAQQADSLSRR